MTARKIPANRRSITGHVPSKKKPGMLAFESKLERDLYVLLEFDPAVLKVGDQPVRIAYISNHGRLSHYTPDCEIHYAESEGRRPMLVEVKYRADLFRDWADLHPKLRAAMRYAKNRGYSFRIITEREIHGVRLENARWFLSYRSMPIPQFEIDQIVTTLASFSEPSTPDKLLGELTSSMARREELLVSLWHAIANQYVLFDMETKLSMSSSIWVPS